MTTGNMQISIYIVICVALVDLLLFTEMTLWDVSYNTVTGLNNIAAIGLAVDYSAHIGNAYLHTHEPLYAMNGREFTKMERRIYKAKAALESMGTSVFHGAMSTFLAILSLGGSKSYVFAAFFKMWIGIIVFGVANGFILLPVLLALTGPLRKVNKTEK